MDAKTVIWTLTETICLRSAAQAELIVPHSRTATRQRRAFSVAGPATWNGLPVTLS